MHMLSRKDLNSAELETVKSDDGCYSERRSPNKRRSDSVCQRIGFIRDRDASRRYTGRSLTRKTLRRSRVFLPSDLWSETTSHRRWQTNKKQHGELRTDRCPQFVDTLFKLSKTCIYNINIAGSRSSYATSRINKK